MLGYRMPIYKNGCLLTKEMMEVLRDYTVLSSVYAYEGYSDGIINGVDVEVNCGSIQIKRGMVKYKDALFFIPDHTTIPLRATNEWQSIKIIFADQEAGTEFTSVQMEIAADTDLGRRDNRIEICRIRLQNGAALRKEYSGFDDMGTEYDTVNLLEAQWAAYGQPGIHPRILKEFAREADGLAGKEAADIAFLMQIHNLQGRTCERDCIRYYLNEKNRETKDRYTNAEIYTGLKSALRQMKSGRGRQAEHRAQRRILVD